MIDLPNKLNFEPRQHLYTDKKGLKYISCSQLVHTFTNPFDTQGYIARACAKKEGVTVEEIRAKWKKTNTDSIIRGNKIHKELEIYIKTREIRESQYKFIVEQFDKLHKNDNLVSEIQVSNSDARLAGTVDCLIMITDNIAKVADFKSNKALNQKSKYGHRMLPPFQHLPDCNFTGYSLQLSLYQYLLESCGIWIDSLTLYYINPETSVLEFYPIKYMEEEVEKLISMSSELAELGEFLDDEKEGKF